LEASRICGGLKDMETEWPGKRIKADPPLMANMLHNHFGAGFKAGNKSNDLAERSPSKASSRNDEAAPSPRTWLRTAALHGIPLRDPVVERSHGPWAS
jgi:hypothetical protein